MFALTSVSSTMTPVDHWFGSRQWLTLNSKDVESTFITLTNRIKKSVSGQAEGGLVPPSKRSLDPNCGFRQGNSIKGLKRESMMPRGKDDGEIDQRQ
jgi:hypothetical protein